MPLFVPLTCFGPLLKKRFFTGQEGSDRRALSTKIQDISLSEGSKVLPSLGACCGGAGGALQDGTEKLLLPEWVFGGGDWGHQRVLFGVGFAVRQQVRRRFGDLYPVDVGLHFELLHQFPRLCDTRRVVGRHWTCLSAPAVLSVPVSPPLGSSSVFSFECPTPRSLSV